MKNAHTSDRSETWEPGAKNALLSWPKKYEMPGEKSKRASATSEKRQLLPGHW